MSNEITSANTLDDYLASLTAARAALAGIGAPAYHAERLTEIADILRESESLLQQEIAEAIEDLLTSVACDSAQHRLHIRQAILDFAAALEANQADNPREPGAFTRLVHLLGGVERARAVGEALLILRYAPQRGESEESAGAGPVLAA